MELQLNTDRWGHPRGLIYLFFAELWERFSFYGMRALLILYMTKHLLYSDDMSFGVYAAYGSLVYASPLIGGMIADRIIGYRKAIILGGVLMAIGHFLMAFDHPVFFYGALAVIIVGNGFFKPNISSLLGKLYQQGDVRRDAGFTIFYMGINIGGWAAPLLCAWLASSYGWHYGFGLAGIGMLTGLFFFYRGQANNVFNGEGGVADELTYSKSLAGLSTGQWIIVITVLFVPLIALLVRFNEYEHYLIWFVAVAVFMMLAYIFMSVDRIEKGRLIVIVYFTTLATLFWAIFEQAGSSLTLFADRNVNLVAFDAAQTNSFNSGFIILLAIPFSLLWSYLSRIQFNPNSALKFGIGLILLGVGFLVFALSARSADELARTPMFYLVAGYFIYTVGEMFLSPIGLSKMTELSPAKFVAFIMGVWFLSNFYGHYFAGIIAKTTSTNSQGGSGFSGTFVGDWADYITGMTVENTALLSEGFQQLYAYVSVYAVFGTLAIWVGMVAILLSPFIARLMGGVQ
jgi:POT family proton-dependent oligopeptide transporter